MALAETRLRVVLVDEATAQLLKLNKAMSSLSSSLQGAGTSGVGNYNKSLNDVADNIAKIERNTSSYLGTLTKLTGLYKTLGTVGNIFGNVFGGAIDYYKDFQSSTVGIAGILSSLTTLNGKQLEWNKSMEFSKDIIRTLRIEALQTSATSKDLIETFRGILGPGMSQGMKIDEILQFSKVGVNAVRSLGLPSNQYLQELRSILQGNIRASSSTLATALGITNEQVKEAKNNAGGVFKFLMDRMKGFVQSTTETAKTLSGQLAILQEAYQTAGAQVGENLLNSYSRTIESINSILLTKNNDGLYELNPEFLEKFQQAGNYVDEKFSNVVKNSKLIVDHFDKIVVAIGALYVLPAIFEKTVGFIQNAGHSIQGLMNVINGNQGKLYDKNRDMQIANAKAQLVKDEANAHLKLLNTINQKVNATIREAEAQKTLNELLDKHTKEKANVQSIIDMLREGGVSLEVAYKRAYDYLKAISSTDVREQERASRMLKALTDNHGKLREETERGIKQTESSYNSLNKWSNVANVAMSSVAQLTGSLSMMSFAVLALTDENNVAMRSMAEGVIVIDTVANAFTGLTGVLKSATEWWGALELAQKSAYLSMAGKLGVVALGASFVAGAMYKGYNDYQNWKAGGKAVIDGDDVRFEAPEDVYYDLDAAYDEKLVHGQNGYNDLVNAFPGGAGGGGKSKGKSPEQIARETQSSYDKLISSIKSSKENAVDFGNAYNKAMAGANKQLATWNKTLTGLQEKNILSEEQVNKAKDLMNEYFAEMERKATEAERSETLNVLKSKIGLADNAMLFGGTQEEQYNRKNLALQEYKDYLERILQDSELNIQQRISYEQQYADAVKQIRQNDMHDFSTAWKATLQELSQQQIDYSEGIRTIYSEFTNFGQNLIGSTKSVTEQLRDLCKNLTSDILNMMMKIYMQGLMMNLIGNIFGGGKVGGGGISTTPNIAGYSYKGGGIGVPGKATGGLANGWTIVGERGPELVNFSNPGRVYTAGQTAQALSNAGNGGVNIKIDLHNESGQQMQAETTGSKFDGESYVVGVVLKAISTNKNGMRNIIKGVATN